MNKKKYIVPDIEIISYNAGEVMQMETASITRADSSPKKGETGLGIGYGGSNVGDDDADSKKYSFWATWSDWE